MVSQARVQAPGNSLEETFLVHPRFAEARDAYIGGFLAIYGDPSPLNRLMIRAARHMIIRFIVCMDATQRREDRATWLSRARLKDMATDFQTASKGQVDAVVERMLALGMLEDVRAPEPSTKRLLKPTAALLDHDEALHVAQAQPITLLSGSQAVRLLASGDQAMHRAMRAATLAVLDRTHRMLAGHAEIMTIIRREAGGLILYKVLRDSREVGPGVRLASLDVAATARQFGVSSVHSRSLLRDAEARGWLAITDQPRKVVDLALQPNFMALCDRWIASVMALFHECCEMAETDVASAR